MSDLDFLNEEIEKPSVFIDESKLSAEYLPENLLFREDNLKELARHFRGLFSNFRSTRRIIITGPVGTGKTSIAKIFGLWAQKKSISENTNIRYVHVNCRRNRTPFMILLTITRELSSHVPTRGYSADELLEMIIELLEAKQATMLLTLDEIDYAIDRGSADLLYALTRTSDDRQNPSHRIALMLISRNSNYLSYLDSSTRSSLTASIMKLDKYSKNQLIQILEGRVNHSFMINSVTRDAISLTAEIASQKGDARQALEIMWYAGKYADKEGSPIVFPEHVRFAKASVEPTILRRTINNMSNHKLLLLLAISRRLRFTKSAYITTGTAKEAYHMICEEFKVKPRRHTQIWEYLKEFEKLSILVSEKSGIGQRGNTQILSIQDASVNELEKEVMKLLQNQSTIIQ